jgi:amidase
MDGFREYDHYDGLGLAELVRRKEVSPAELVEEAIRRIETVNPQINAVIHPMYDLARQQVQQGLPEGPFRGVPFLLKDLLVYYAGVPTRSGSRFFRDFVPDHDSEIVRRYRQAGVVVLGLSLIHI